MENNLDDILIDPLEEKQKKSKPKRWLLIGVAFALLIAVVGIVLYFVFAKKDDHKGLETIHSELERFETLAQKQTLESQMDDEFDKLIAEIKAKHQDAPVQKTSKESMTNQDNETFRASEKEQAIDLIKVLQKKQEIKSQEKQAKSQNNVSKPLQAPNTKMQEISKTKQNASMQKQAKNINEPSIPKNASTSSAFDSLETPRGFYLQVGVFSNTPNADFLSKLSAFSYRVEKFNNKGKIANRYLVGPFKAREEAEAKILEVTQKITKPVVVEIP